MFSSLLPGFTSGPDPRTIDHEEFEQAVEAGKCVVDVREAHEFASAHIPRSLNMPLSTRSACLPSMRSRSAFSKAHAQG